MSDSAQAVPAGIKHEPEGSSGKAKPTRAERRQLQDHQRACKILSRMGPHRTQFIVARHGETDWNKEYRLQGQCSEDPPLNQLGEQQAAALADRLAGMDFSAIYSSDLRRAVQTATAIASKKGLQVQTSRELRERSLGVLEGLRRAEAGSLQPEAWACLMDPSTATRVPGGESLDELRARVVQAVQDVASKHPGDKVVIVTHGGALNAMYWKVVGHTASERMVNCGVNEFHVEGSVWAAVRWNDAEHLQHVGFMTSAAGGGSSGA